MVQYYTLREAAEKLRMDPEKLKEMAKNNQLRAFQDRGTLRFRAPEIDEMARSLGLGSDPDLQLGELPAPKSGSKPPSSGKSPAPGAGKSPPPSSRRTMHVPADADLSLVGDEHDVVPIGDDPASHRGKPLSGSKPKSGPPKSGPPKSGPKGPQSPAPSHDSDVRLVSDGGGLDFQLEVDDNGSIAKPKEPPGGPKSPKAQKKRPSKFGPEEKPDSGVRIVPLDQASDSDVKIVQGDRPDDPNVVLGSMKTKTPSDSDVRMELADPPARQRGSQDPFVTEEIELDLEAMKEEQAKAKRRRPTKSSPELPTTSPFELSEEDAGEGSRGGKRTAKKDKDSSSDFELSPAEQSPIELGSDEIPIPLAKDDDEVGLGEISGGGGHPSGINLRDPRDSGISLEEGGSEEIEFTAAGGLGSTPKPGPRTPKPGPRTPKPGPRTPKPTPGGQDSSGEFELSMDDSPTGEEGNTSSEFELSLDPGTGEQDSSSEFELSLDANGPDSAASGSDLEDSSAVDSDSEFELSIDPSGELEGAGEAGLTDDEKDIFETDFEVPALEDESASEAVALDESDTDLEDSDFELDLSDEDLAAEEESGSQVVALEEGEDAADDEVELDEEEPPSRKPRKKVSAETEDFDEPLIDLDDMDTDAAAEEEAAVGAAALAPAAPWGVVPALFLFPAFIVMFFVVIMSFELLQTSWGYHTGGYGARLFVDPIARGLGMMDKDVP